LTDTLTPRLANALQYAFQLFGSDARKGSQVPVLAHLLGVCALVQQDGGDEDEAIAALLHDVLEDKPSVARAEELQAQFGAQVLSLIETATDTPPGYTGGPKPPWKERKLRYLEHVRRLPPSELRVTVADKIDNVRSLLADYRRLGDSLWTRFNAGREDQLWYYQTALEAYEASGFKGPFMAELTQIIGELASAPII
jgi:(p)ppGpp synthase/HD superfamily hydrolase